MIDLTLLQKIADALHFIPFSWILFDFLKDILIAILTTGPAPKHVGFIMDGNRRFAKKKALPLKDGHAAGALSLISVWSTSNITVYAFSIENFNRSKEEVDTLLALLRDKLKYLSLYDDSYARQNQVRVRIIGNRSMIPDDILEDLEQVERITNLESSSRTLNVCFPYTSRDDIVHSIQGVCENGTSKANIDVAELYRNMYMGPDSPQLDLLVRTSGHTRLSDFMLWQCTHNCKIEFVSTLWPDFKFIALYSILLKWSYYHKKDIMNQRVNNTPPDKVVDITSLPAPPPFATVTGN
ncbi:hypothetical protein CA3LBN_002529 [Candidozyma haemuli]|uniref:Alkyl transferase n=1 Tax=Candidozyma haemuli TaxID=45357 RepID=A0ABX8I4Q7_9ASCO|nr:hypothetical protein CA3LBN_002529 [[Candida] haemuloni]